MDGTKRTLPGDLVVFRNKDADVMIVRTQPKVRRYDDARDWSLTDDGEKNRLADMLESSQAVDLRTIYFVIMASKKRALVLKPDTLQLLVAFTEDLRVLLPLVSSFSRT